MGVEGPAAVRIAARIEALIIDGVLQPGAALPGERALCGRLGVSRTALREGLNVLRGRGVIETRHGRGSFVALRSEQAGDGLLLRQFATQPHLLYDLLEVRAMLEGESARLAAIRGTDADFVLMARRHEELRVANEHPERYDAEAHARLDHGFHLAICEASHNPVLVQTLRSLTDLMAQSVLAAVNNLYHRPQHKRQIDQAHARLYQAVLAREPERARAAAIDHLLGIRDSLRDIEQEGQRLIRATMRLEGWG